MLPVMACRPTYGRGLVLRRVDWLWPAPAALQRRACLLMRNGKGDEVPFSCRDLRRFVGSYACPELPQGDGPRAPEVTGELALVPEPGLGRPPAREESVLPVAVSHAVSLTGFGRTLRAEDRHASAPTAILPICSGPIDVPSTSALNHTGASTDYECPRFDQFSSAATSTCRTQKITWRVWEHSTDRPTPPHWPRAGMTVKIRQAESD
jgi:hypothetical protein